MRLLGWTLIQKTKWRQREGSHQAKERDFRRNQPCQHIDFGNLVSRVVRKYIFVARDTQSEVLCYGSLSKITESLGKLVKASRKDKLHNLWGPVQNTNVGPSVKEIIKNFKRTAEG